MKTYFFKDSLTSPSSSGDIYLINLFNQYYESCFKEGLIKKRKRTDVINKQLEIAKIIALNCFESPEGEVALPLSKKFLDRKKTRYDNKIFDAKNTNEALKIMEADGLIEIEKGSAVYSEFNIDGLDNDKTEIIGKETTRIHNSSKLSEIYKDLDKHLIHKNPNEIILLKTGVSKKRKLSDYEDNNDSIKARNNLDKINKFLSNFVFRLQDKILPLPNLQRHFHNDFKHYGRFHNSIFEAFGAEKYYRPFFSINKEKLISLDFNACSLSIIATLNNIDLPEDPYQKGRLSIFPREFVKKLIQHFLFSPKQPTRIYRGGRQLLKDNGFNSKRYSKDIIFKIFHDEYSFLKQRTDIDVFFYESRLLELIMLKCVEANIPFIPLHDCIYIPKNKETQAVKIFEMSSIEVLGSKIPFEIETSEN